MSANISESTASSAASPNSGSAAPKGITNAQTVCNERNEKGKLCNGHLKQLRTAGEASEVHLRGDDVLSKCQTCGQLYMGPPLGHVRDPRKQQRFVEAELTALLQAAGGTLPVIKKNEQGVFVMVESAAEKAPAAAKPAAAATKAAPAAKPATAAPPTPAAAKTATPPVPKAAAAKPKVGGEPNRQLFKRSTYVGVADTGPIAGETFAGKVERLKKVSAAAKQRQEEGGGPAHAAEATAAAAPAAAPEVEVTEAMTAGDAVTTSDPKPAVAAESAAPANTGKADRTLMKRYTYCGVIDTGPVAGETFEQKVERLQKVSAAAKQRSEEGGGAH